MYPRRRPSVVFVTVPVVMLISVLLVSQTMADDYATRRRLIRDLFSNPSAHPPIRPTTSDTRNATEIEVTFWPLGVLKLDEEEHVLEINMATDLFWHDPTMLWDNEAYGFIWRITASGSNIWIPRLEIKGALDTKILQEEENNIVAITHRGLVQWYSAQRIRTYCDMDFIFYPADQQTCEVCYSSGLFLTSNDIELYTVNEGFSLDHYTQNSKWDLVKTTSKYHNSTDTSKAKLCLSLTLRRYSMRPFLTRFIPSVFMALTVPVMLFPASRDPRISGCLLIAHVVYYCYVTDSVPALSRNTTFLWLYCLIIFISAISAFIFSAVLQNRTMMGSVKRNRLSHAPGLDEIYERGDPDDAAAVNALPNLDSEAKKAKIAVDKLNWKMVRAMFALMISHTCLLITAFIIYTAVR